MAVPVPGRVAEALRRSTVVVRTGSGRGAGGGSGVMLASDRVVTNAHVVREGKVAVESWEGKTVSGTVVRTDQFRDLALLSVPGMSAPPAQLGDSDALRAGTPVIAVGNPFGFTGAVSTGIVHASGGSSADGAGGAFFGQRWIHADVRLAPGNSGGPLADLQGLVIGINTMVMAGGLALAVPSRSVQSFLARTGQRPSLGVTLRPVALPDGRMGLLILELETGGAADRASLLPGDVLVAANETRFRFVDDLQSALDEAPRGLLKVEFVRGGEKRPRHVAVQLARERVTTAA
ncbi:MAG: trypsin-like peptidase domain-containing protein [Acidobacteriaceae bacterium]|nr:trypsin-like peptidase domain-containing protein [Acidobacteriaceae bacterium]